MDELDLGLLLRDLVIDLVAIIILALGIYYHRYRRRDHTIGFIAFNVCLFTVAAALTSTSTVNLGVGFGLFAVLSIVRLRSDEATQSEIGYTMVSLVIGLLNGLPGLTMEVKIVFSGVLVVTMFVFDHPALFKVRQYQRLRIELDKVVTDEAALRQEIATRLDCVVRQLTVLDIDFVHETMRLDVRIQH